MALVLVPLLVLTGGCDSSLPCPPEVARAKHLVVVETATMHVSAATLETYARRMPSAEWISVGARQPAVVGTKGVAWGWGFQSLAKHGEPLKIEGDKRTPAGIFPLGATFGFEPWPQSTRHIVITPGESVCVDDALSPHYSQIVTAEAAGEGASGEKMWEIGVYKRGIVVDYATDRTERAGSCIFVHIWAGPDQGTSGCVAAAERDVVALQEIASRGDAVIAVVPQEARERFRGCLPSRSN
jgi:D-alanyl-D-alanine dipeptidase